MFVSSVAVSAQPTPPEISRGVRVMMADSTVVEQRRQTNRLVWEFFVPQQLEVLSASASSGPMKGTALSTTDEVLSFFWGLPSATQQQGLWVTYMGRTLSQADQDKIAALTDSAIRKGLSVFVCLPKQAAPSGSWLVAWDCERTSPQKDIGRILCQPMNKPSTSGAPLWACEWSVQP